MKVTPTVKPNEAPRGYDALSDGECFLYGGDLWIKCDRGDQDGMKLSDGLIREDFCEANIIPVNAEVKWSYKTEKKGKK